MFITLTAWSRAYVSSQIEIEHAGTTSVIPAHIKQGMTIDLNDAVTIVGWGQTHAGSGLSDELRYMNTIFLPREHCDAMYYDGLLTGDVACTGNEYVVTDICPVRIRFYIGKDCVTMEPPTS